MPNAANIGFFLLGLLIGGFIGLLCGAFIEHLRLTGK